jgi:hypothetical protein
MSKHAEAGNELRKKETKNELEQKEEKMSK